MEFNLLFNSCTQNYGIASSLSICAVTISSVLLCYGKKSLSFNCIQNNSSPFCSDSYSGCFRLQI